MRKKNNGGAAFPATSPVIDYGMTLRDWFAGQALVGILLNNREIDVTAEAYKTAVASIAYDLSDAMLKERDK